MPAAGKANAAAGEKCGRALGPGCVHPFMCKAGPARLMPHRGVANIVAKIGRNAGARVDMERPCPDLYQGRYNEETGRI